MRAYRLLPSMLLLAMLTACGGGAPTEQNPVTSGSPATAGYTGPLPATDDVQSFKVNVWDNLNANNRCGQCHGAGQAPAFVRRDDVNLAYQAANPIVNLASPRESRMVAKVAGGHNCWLGSPDACADILSTWIGNWAGAGAGTQQIVLRAPTLKDPGSSKSLPADSAAFATTVWPLAREYCAGCHTADARAPQAPYFASADVDAAYATVRTKINLDSPANSRLVVRLRGEFHNCWDDCAANAATMQSAIEALAGRIPATVVDPSLLASKALTLYGGQPASGGNRYNASVIALYEFKTGSGRVAYDTSGVDPALDLTLSGDVQWLGGWGLDLRGGKAQGSTTASRKLHDRIRGTGEYSVEAWVVPANVSQEDARIVSYSGGTTLRNFTLGQTLYSYDFLGRASTTGANGDPALRTAAADEDLQASLQHVVATFDPVRGRRIYVNGEYTGDLDGSAVGTLGDWDDTFALVLGNEVSGNRVWQGQVRFVAIHARALTPTQVQANFDAGVGEKYFLLFSLAHLVDVPQAYLLFEVSQFDSHGYLFEKPTFISLDPNARPGELPLRGLRVGMNGRELPVGQTWRTLDTRVSDAKYTSRGQILSEVGAVFALDRGAGGDEFFLSFEQLGSRSNVRTEPVLLQPVAPMDLPEAPDVGLRVFDEVNATFAALTDVSELQSEVRTTYLRVRQQLPTSESIEGFVAAQQVGIAQLAIEYCNALVDDPGLRAGYFPGIDFGASAGGAFATAAQRSRVIDPLLARMLGQDLASQPDPNAVRVELDGLIVRLAACGPACPPARTPTVAKAACAAVLGSAVTAIQ